MKKLILKVSIITLGVISAASVNGEYKETYGSYEQNKIARQLYCASVAMSANTWEKMQEAIFIIHEGKAYALAESLKIEISKVMIDKETDKAIKAASHFMEVDPKMDFGETKIIVYQRDCSGIIDITNPNGEYTNNYESFQYKKISQQLYCSAMAYNAGMRETFEKIHDGNAYEMAELYKIKITDEIIRKEFDRAWNTSLNYSDKQNIHWIDSATIFYQRDCK